MGFEKINDQKGIFIQQIFKVIMISGNYILRAADRPRQLEALYIVTPWPIYQYIVRRMTRYHRQWGGGYPRNIALPLRKSPPPYTKNVIYLLR